MLISRLGRLRSVRGFLVRTKQTMPLLAKSALISRGETYKGRDKQRFCLVGEGFHEGLGPKVETNRYQDTVDYEKGKIYKEEGETDAVNPCASVGDFI